VTCGFIKRISHIRLIIGDRAETERQGEGDISHFDFFEKFFKASAFTSSHTATYILLL
jgi:hypothetical protein